MYMLLLSRTMCCRVNVKFYGLSKKKKLNMLRHLIYILILFIIDQNM